MKDILQHLALYHRRYFYGTVLFIILSSFIFLHEKVSIQDVDTAWVISFADKYVNEGIETDTVFRNISSKHILRFGKLQFMLYGWVLNGIGWSRGNAILISTFLAFLSIGLWYLVFRALGRRREIAAGFAVFMLCTYPLFHAAHMARAEAFVSCLIPLSLLLFIRRRYLSAGFVAMAAAEPHPMGLLSFFYIGGYALYLSPYFYRNRRTFVRTTLLFSAGAGAGLVFYFALHPEMFSLDMLTKTFNNSKLIDGRERPFFSYLDMHFIHRRDELTILIFPLLFYLTRRQWRRDPLPGIMLLSVLASLIVFRRPNHNYPVYVYPAIVFTAMAGLRAGRFVKPAVIGMLALFLMDVNDLHENYPKHHTQKIMERAAQMVPDDNLPVIALSDYYFLFRNRTYYPVQYRGSWNRENITECYYVDIVGYTPHIKRILDRRYRKTEIGSFSPLPGKRIRILKYRKK